MIRKSRALCLIIFFFQQSSQEISMTTTTEAPQVRKTRKPAEKRGFTEVGKFFAKVRIDLSITSEEWAKQLGVSNTYVNNVERGNKEFDLVFVRKVFAVITAEHYLGFAELVAQKLGVLVIPSSATSEQISHAFSILNTPASQLVEVHAGKPSEA